MISIKNIFFLSLILILPACESSISGEGKPDFAQDFKTEKFTKIEANGKFKLLLIPNDSSYVSVQSHQNLLDNIKVSVSGQTLELSEKNLVEQFESYVVYAYTSQPIKSIQIGQNVLMETSEALTSEDLDIEVSQEAKIRQFELYGKELKIYLSGKAEAEISGNALSTKVSAKDFAQANLIALDSREVKVDLENESEVKVNALDELNGDVTNNAKLYYKGNPSKDVDVKENGEMLKD